MNRRRAVILVLIGLVAGVLVAQIPAALAGQNGSGMMGGAGMMGGQMMTPSGENGGMGDMMAHMNQMNEMMQNVDGQKMMARCTQMMEEYTERRGTGEQPTAAQ